MKDVKRAKLSYYNTVKVAEMLGLGTTRLIDPVLLSDRCKFDNLYNVVSIDDKPVKQNG